MARKALKKTSKGSAKKPLKKATTKKPLKKTQAKKLLAKKPLTKKPLGRGLSALVSTPSVSIKKAASPEQDNSVQFSSENRIVTLDIEKIARNTEQPRQEFKQLELEELAESIKSLGVIQPILVRSLGQGYQIVAGERRFRAAKLAGLTQVPVIIRDLDDRQTLEIALVENIQRQNLNPVEEAKAYDALINEFDISQQDLAERVGKSRSNIANYLRVLKLPEDVLDLLAAGKISMGHAKAIASVKEPAAQINLANKVIKDELSVRQLEDIVGRVVVVGGQRRPKQRLDANIAYSDLENRLKNVLGTKVRIKCNKNASGSIVVEFYSEEELGRIVDLIEA